MKGFTGWICEGRRLEAVLFLIAVFFMVFMVVVGPRKVASAEPPQAWELWQDRQGNTSLIKIQDGSCSIYVARGIGGEHVSVAVGKGCRP